jgi:hypothetical protein
MDMTAIECDRAAATVEIMVVGLGNPDARLRLGQSSGRVAVVHVQGSA